MAQYINECITNTESRLAHARQILSAQMREVLQLEDLLKDQQETRRQIEERELFSKYLSA